MSQELIEQIKAADSKEALEPLADALGVKLMARKGLESMRADLLEKAQEQAKIEGDKEGDPGAKPAPKRRGRAKKQGEKRRLRSSKNGRVFTYTAALAKRNDMKEV